ncbi:hypothetical protein, variant [Phialophora macrospora]|uniref:Transcription factor domain-containing protein n=1 Tax=Phialophora macrospora TaxID=1851006 RepID=A0A0D2E8Z3_9EURO|nr:hypothetical protein, variant [Phialophora macrospora]
MSQQIHFVETKPGTALDSSQVRALRSHVRKVNLERSNQKSTRRLENFRSLTITDFSEAGKAKGAKKKQSSQPDVTQLETEIQDLPWGEDPPQDCPLAPGSPEIPTRAFQCLSTPDGQFLPKRCNCNKSSPPHRQSPGPSRRSSPIDSPQSDGIHPHAVQIANAIDVDEARINDLLRSCAFQVAAEPLLPSSVTDGDFSALPLFPECLSNSAFLESLALKTKAIECLRGDLRKDDPNIRALTIGTILLLSCVAYHCGDLEESTAHSEGLYKLLEHCHTDGIRLRAEVLRAIFWQHLLGTALVCDQHRFLQPDFQFLLNRPQDFPTLNALPTVPLGFELHEYVISADVLLSIRIILYLQNPPSPGTSDLTMIEDLQARVEARLVFHEKSCKEFGPIAECCRVAVYIVSYISSSTTWKSAFVPLRLAEKLLTYLEKTNRQERWRYRRDLFLWLLLVGASVGKGQNCFAAELASRYQQFIESIRGDVTNWTDLKNGPRALHNMMKSFIYADGWVAKRHLIPSWSDLERTIFLCGSEEADTDMDTEALLQELVPDTNLFE